ncbi:MAG: proton-conducting transporter membrane subunit [Campylobacterota bacterium]|nr:proton-conducting transporter membrane subunit [Campylobacterota bacterium]
MQLIMLLIFLPMVSAFAVVLSRSMALQYMLTGVTALTLTLISGYLFFTPLEFSVNSVALLDYLFIGADIILLLFFISQGYAFKNMKVLGLALLQLLIYLFIEIFLAHGGGVFLHVDTLAKVMFLIINGVGGIIVVYALHYMRDEAMSALKKRFFIAGLLLFLSIMNLIVMANSLLLFFFLFEMTTLASYLLIAFRGDDISRANALRALWMNQIGGVVILLGTVVAIGAFESVYFDVLMHASGGYLLFVIALLSMAAWVKGALLPFDSWLLGAMVAPTPVSAILHSATMVKIAPFMILKFAPVLAGTLAGSLLSVGASLVFVAASYLALSKEMLKEILGYSTIALLALMMAIAAIGTAESSVLVMVLIFFHAVSKALLFLGAGVIEKQHHVKSIEAMKGLVERAPQSTWIMILGFIALTLPPFGLFMGKLWAIELLASTLVVMPQYLIVLLALIVGSVIMVLLYFKVASHLLANRSDEAPHEKEYLPIGFSFPLYYLIALLGFATLFLLYNAHENALYWLGLPFMIIIIVPYFLKTLRSFDRSKVYHCGEREEFDGAELYFQLNALSRERLYLFFTLIFIGLGVSGVLS